MPMTYCALRRRVARRPTRGNDDELRVDASDFGSRSLDRIVAVVDEAGEGIGLLEDLVAQAHGADLR